MIVRDLSQQIFDQWDDGHRAVLRFKLNGRSDREIAETMGLSRPTVSKRKREVLGRLELELAELRPGLRRAVMDRLGEILESGGSAL
jgi:DNA-directed RNA polymerase specialized sigma24 family protein